jgi:hypothetical protein
MTTNENVHKMRAQILNLRSAVMTISTALCRFPACGTSEGCNLRCVEARNMMTQIREDMQDLVISARMILSAAFSPQPEVWDTFWCSAEDKSCPERTLVPLGKEMISDQDEYIRFYGQVDDEMFRALGTEFSKHEWDVLSAEDAWQNGHRLSQILPLAKYLETEMAKKFDLLTSMVSNCEVGKKAKPKSSVTA